MAASTMNVRWIELLSSDREGVLAVGREFGIHPLAIEDCLNRNQRAKFEDFETHQFLVWFVMAGGELVEFEFVIFPHAIILVTGSPAPEGGTWKSFLRINPDQIDAYHVLHRALDRAMDITMQYEAMLHQELQAFEEKILSEQTNPRTLLEIKRRLADTEYGVLYLASVVAQLLRFLNPKDDLRWRLRDLLDHCERTHQRLIFHRAQIASTMDMYWGITAKRTNDRIKKLTLLAAVSVPLTFWTSFWGMNFESIPFDRAWMFEIAIGVMVLSGLVIFLTLRRKGYWEKD